MPRVTPTPSSSSRSGPTLTTASGSSVVLINGADPCNVFWQVGSSATLGTTTDFVGTVIARPVHHGDYRRNGERQAAGTERRGHPGLERHHRADMHPGWRFYWRRHRRHHDRRPDRWHDDRRHDRWHHDRRHHHRRHDRWSYWRHYWRFYCWHDCWHDRAARPLVLLGRHCWCYCGRHRRFRRPVRPPVPLPVRPRAPLPVRLPVRLPVPRLAAAAMAAVTTRVTTTRTRATTTRATTTSGADKGDHDKRRARQGRPRQGRPRQGRQGRQGQGRPRQVSDRGPTR